MNKDKLVKLVMISVTALAVVPACGDDAGNSSGTEVGDGDGDGTGETAGDGDGDPGDGDGDPGDGDGDPGDGDGDPGDGDGDPGDGDGDPGDGDGDPGDGDGDGDGCIPTEDIEVTCDQIDNNCDGLIDNVDVGLDGFCDCLSIGIIGATGYAPTANFEAWLEEQGTSVTRTLLQNQPDVVTPEFLAQYDFLIVDRIERSLSGAEAAAIEAFVKDNGNGMLTLIGYNFDNNNPAPERDRANTVLAPFGLAYTGGYVHTQAGVIPTFDQMHPVSMGVTDVNFHGGIVPTDTGNQGSSVIFATVPSGDAGLAHETAMGGRVIVWGDEWITFDSDWQGYADVQKFWSQMVGWAKPQDFCGSPQ